MTNSKAIGAGGGDARRLTGHWCAAAVLLAVALGITGLLFLAGRANAHDHQPPKTALMKQSKELQAGRLTDEYRWSYPSRNGKACWTDDAFFGFAFPKDVPTVTAGSKLRVRIQKSHKPDSFSLQEVDREGVPRGEVGVLLKPVVRDGRTVAWDAVFAVERPDSVYRLLAEGHWRDRDCSNSEPVDPDQFARWTFRVNTRS